MTNYEVLISKRAVKQFKMLDKKTQKRIKENLNCLHENPFEKRSKCDIKKLILDLKFNFYRLRIGDYRLIYSILRKKVKITEIAHRKNAYKFLE